MKKTCIVIIMAAILLMGFTSCHNPLITDTPALTDNTETPTETASTPVETETPVPTPTEDPAVVAQRERDTLEAARKLADGEFYVPLKALADESEKADGDDARCMYIVDSVISKNVGNEDNAVWEMVRTDDANIQLYKEYVEALAAGNTTRTAELAYLENSLTQLEKIIGTILGTELNAVVLNIKSGDGGITIPTTVQCVDTVKSNANRFTDMAALLKQLKGYGIYTIARVTTFQDDMLAEYNSSEHAIRKTDGTIWLDDNYSAWVDAFDEWVQKYNIAVAKEAALIGFDEINFDYVRFPEGRKWGTYYKEYCLNHNITRSDEIIRGFLEEAYEALQPYNVNVSADVFGLVARQWDSEDCLKIGQNWYQIATVVDYICPMIYPSHYSTGWYGFEYPDMNPYGMVKGAMKDSIERISSTAGDCKVRLWVQDFTAKYLYNSDNIYYYGYDQIYGEILAMREFGEFTYSFWNNGINYNPSKYIFPTDTSMYPLATGDYDLIGRTPAGAAKEYLSVMSNINDMNKYMLYILVPMDTRPAEYNEWLTANLPQIQKVKVLGYTVGTYTFINADNTQADIMITVKILADDGVTEITKDVVWKAIKEKSVWKVVPQF